MKLILYYIALFLLIDGVLGILLSTDKSRNGDLSRLDYLALIFGVLEITFSFVIGFLAKGKTQ